MYVVETCKRKIEVGESMRLSMRLSMLGMSIVFSIGESVIV